MLNLLTSALWCPWAQAAGRQKWKGVSISGLRWVETPKSFPQLVSPPPSSSQAFASSLLLYGLQAGLPMSELAFPWPCLTALSPCLPIASPRGVYSKKSSREGGYQATLGWKCCLFLGPYLLTPLLPSAQEIHMFPSSPPRGSGLHSL